MVILINGDSASYSHIYSTLYKSLKFNFQTELPPFFHPQTGIIHILIDGGELSWEYNLGKAYYKYKELVDHMHIVQCFISDHNTIYERRPQMHTEKRTSKQRAAVDCLSW